MLGRFSKLAASLLAVFAMPAFAADYLIEGTFESQNAPIYDVLGGGSFTGSFSVADGTFPIDPSGIAYPSAFTLSFFDRNDALVTTIVKNIDGGNAYFWAANSGTYGGLPLYFYNNDSYLQLVVPLAFSGTGSASQVGIGNFSYALADGTNYAYVAQATVTSVPEPASWALMIGGFGLVGGAMRRRGWAPAAA